MDEQKALREAVDEHRKEIMAIDGVVGVAVGLSPNRPDLKCILVYVTMGEWPPDLPTELEGHPVDIVKTGKGFRPL